MSEVLISPDQTKAFVVVNRVGSRTMIAALVSDLNWTVTDAESVPEECQVYGIIRHPISKYASSLAYSWTECCDIPNELQLTVFKRLLDNDGEWLMSIDGEHTAPQHPCFSPFPNIKLVMFDNFNDIWDMLGIDNPGYQHNDSRAAFGFRGPAKVLIERTVIKHEEIVLDRYDKDFMVWKKAAKHNINLPPRYPMKDLEINATN